MEFWRQSLFSFLFDFTGYAAGTDRKDINQIAGDYQKVNKTKNVK